MAVACGKKSFILSVLYAHIPFISWDFWPAVQRLSFCHTNLPAKWLCVCQPMAMYVWCIFVALNYVRQDLPLPLERMSLS